MIRLKSLLLEVDKTKTSTSATPENLEQAKIIVDGLVNRGFSTNEAISLAGNMSVESMDISTGKWFTTTATDGTAYGIMQWQGDRLTALKAFAKYKGTAVSSLSTQLDFVKFELKDGYILHPTDKTKKLKQQLIPGIPVSLVYIVDSSGKPSIPRHFTSASTETKAFAKSLKGTIKDTTAALTVNVFRPSQPHVDRRIANAIAINNYINSPTSKTNTNTDQKTNNNTNQKTLDIEYTVKEKETLGGIANRHNTTVDAILKKNPGLSADKIKAGQKIKI